MLRVRSNAASAVSAFDDDDLLEAAKQTILREVAEGSSASSPDFFDTIKRLVLDDDHLHQHLTRCIEAFVSADSAALHCRWRTDAIMSSAYVVNLATLAQWLLPVVSPIPYLVKSILNGATAAAESSSTVTADTK